jgi:hypothetical protein
VRQGNLQQHDLMSRSRRAVRWLQPGLVVKRWVLTSGLGLLIALEVLQNLTAYLREHVVQIELVLITALTALARKVIVMPEGMLKTPGELAGLGVAVLALASAYWLVRQSHVSRLPTRREPTSGFLEQDQLPQPGDAAQG